MRSLDVIVVGCGGLGSAALYRLARRLGPGVLGIEQFRLDHDRGASQDHSRIIRLAQHELQYAALAPHAYTAWREVEQESGQHLVTTTGGLVIEARQVRAGMDTGTRNIEGYAGVLKEFGIDYEFLEAGEIMAHWGGGDQARPAPRRARGNRAHDGVKLETRSWSPPAARCCRDMRRSLL